MKKLTLILFLLVLIFFGTAVLANTAINETETAEAALDQEILPRDLEVGKPALLPDSPFYFVKVWSRGIQDLLTFSPIAKAELKQRFANEKLMEVKEMIEKNKDGEAVENALKNYKNEVEKVGEAAERIKGKAEENERVGSFLDKYIQHQTLHQRLLQKLEEQVPPRAFDKLQEARERHLEKFGEVMNRLEENKEQLRERLEKNMEEVKGSDFKEFKNLEVLKHLEEKVPEQAKEAIQKAIENTLSRLEIKIEQLPPEKLERFKAYAESISGEKEKHKEILEELREKLEEKPILQQQIIESAEGIMERINIRDRERETDNARICIQLWDPVCGKNGKTYSNKCFAESAGVEATQKGACLPDKIQTRTITPTTNTEIKTEPEAKTETKAGAKKDDEASTIKKQIEETNQQLKELQEQIKYQY